MDPSTLLYLAGFFFILGAGIVGLIWIMVTLVRGILNKGKAPQNKNFSVLARLLRDLRTQNLVVEMDGKTFNEVRELSPAQQKRLGITASVLAKWLAQPTSTPATSPDLPSPVFTTDNSEAAVPVVTPEPAIQPVPAAVLPPAEDADPLGLNQLPDLNEWIPAEYLQTELADHHVPPFATETNPEVKPVSTQLLDVVGGILIPTPATALVYKSIAMQINDILQARISGTPFAMRGITVSDGPDHGVLVTMDGQKFLGVKDVPDDDVRNLIRSSVLEWEKQSKPPAK